MHQTPFFDPFPFSYLLWVQTKHSLSYVRFDIFGKKESLSLIFIALYLTTLRVCEGESDFFLSTR